MMKLIGWDCETVYCGFWNNDHNISIYRGTLTLPNQWGLILVGFFTLFITLASGQLWATISFVVHQVNASSKAEGDLYHQLQLILRNTDTDIAFIGQLSKILWAHRGTRSKTRFKGIVLILFASLYCLGFALAGGFYSRLITAHDPSSLAITRNCGWFEEPTLQNPEVPSFDNIYSYPREKLFEYVNSISVMSRNAFRRSAAYSRSCYRRFGENSTICSNFVQPTLPYVVTRDLPCPFHEQACNGTAISLDTGKLRSDTHLGLNTRPEDALSVRKVLTCVPLAGERYTPGWEPVPESIASILQLPPNTRSKGYSFGPRTASFGYYSDLNHTASIDEIDWKLGRQPYSLRWANAVLNLPPNPIWSQFTPIADVLNTTADTTIIGLTSRYDYGAAITDPWFRADNCTVETGSLPPMFCSAPQPLSFLACQEQYQFCKDDSSPAPGSSDPCTPLTGLYNLTPDLFLAKSVTPWNGTTLAGLNAVQTALYRLLSKTLSNSQLHWQLGFIGHENLVAQDALLDGGFGMELSAALPPNQWQIEVANWMNVSLAHIQRSPAMYARPTDYDVGAGVSSLTYIERAATRDTADKALCRAVKLRSARHTSFSVWALGATLLAGLLCIFSGALLRPLFACAQRRSGHGAYKTQQWNDSSAFQLQRMAAEGRGIGPWTGRDGDVPRLAQDGQRFHLAERPRFEDFDSGPVDYTKSGGAVRYRALSGQHAYLEGDVELQHLR